MCVAPRAGTADRRGTATDENNWLRSWTNELYLWYGEVTDRDPALVRHDEDYFPLLKTNATTASGQPKDKFHFTYDTAVWQCAFARRRGSGVRRRVLDFRLAPPTTSSPHRRRLHRSRHRRRRASSCAAMKFCRSMARTPSTAARRRTSTS